MLELSGKLFIMIWIIITFFTFTQTPSSFINLDPDPHEKIWLDPRTQIYFDFDITGSETLYRGVFSPFFVGNLKPKSLK